MKTRNLSVAEYFLTIQKEYLLAEFRRKIYPSLKDKAYYEKVMQFKKEKIIDISSRNDLKNIFTDSVIYNDIRGELFNVNGKPLFQLSAEDLLNYYSIGNEFSFEGEIWMLKSVKNNAASIESLRNSEQKTVKLNEIHRIL